jgi:glucose-6-phosphate isomerase
VNKSNLTYKNNIPKKILDNKSIKDLSQRFHSIFIDTVKDLNNPKKTLNVLNKNYKFNFKLKDLKKFKNFKKIAIIGMGGSILGAQAIYSFLEKKIKKKIYFIDDIDEKKISNLKKNENLSMILFIIISKSGNTVETLSNTFSLNIIKKNAKNIILISEKKNNYLFSLSKKFNLFHVEHKNFIGGRYSVLSEVGILPAYLMGLNILNLRSSIINLKKKEKLFLKQSATQITSLHSVKKINNIVFLNYSPKIEKFLFWCQQLIAESLGKKGRGFFPVISNVPKDHHSLLQLYLDGPRDKLFHIFSLCEDTKEKINFKKNAITNDYLDKKKLSTVKLAQKNALVKVFQKKQIPFREFRINEINEKTLGKLFSYFMYETIIIGKLIKVDPFNQPAVEQVKIYTKKLLS